MLTIYTDASVNKGYGCVCFVIVTEDTFIKRGVNFFKLQEDFTTTDAEYFGVTSALQWVKDNMGDVCINLYTDCKPIHNNWTVYKKLRDFDKLNIKLRHLSSLVDSLSIHHIKAHSMDFNPNKLCDITSRVYRWAYAKEV